ncbi:membrane protein insertion efficiency factor YidD [Rubrivivax gelatinosus]|uniref:Putative membrane protein insertion efficiency factor n=1 Tax=Rubrivivax gelatinosus TaxID=28068 RepID=A0ABS1DNZ7_RUBGE|nr:membrane protein insertion efficiency factor YidD [Rubrivivax gelatinosus]MBK1612574.1 membrane protein insertion efficiency factor YidD [Rubrivivax gelatinosus]MBK1711681.1 membrane protein insertion efficiency factor YidD [Rubrivivax gelatinosus]
MLAELARLPQRLLVLLVRAYRLLLKPWLGNACRFEPSCSQYALDALGRHGAAGGSALTVWRLLRCHPLCNGGCDPVPERFPNPARGLFTRLVRPHADDAL